MAHSNCVSSYYYKEPQKVFESKYNKSLYVSSVFLYKHHGML